jgi:microcystin-dependent protein
MFCEGQLLPISEHENGLFPLIGTTYGGDGQSTFALPDLRGRLPLHQGGGFVLAEEGGAEEVTLTAQQIPAHSHPLTASTSAGTQNAPANNVVAASPSVTVFVGDAPDSNMAASAVGSTGGSQPHNNFQPYLCVDFIISLFGTFPSQT